MVVAPPADDVVKIQACVCGVDKRTSTTCLVSRHRHKHVELGADGRSIRSVVSKVLAC